MSGPILKDGAAFLCAQDVADAFISADGGAASIGDSYVAWNYIGGEDFVAVVKESDGVCVLLAMASPISSPNNLGLTLPGRWGLVKAAVWPRSMHACTGSSAPRDRSL